MTTLKVAFDSNAAWEMWKRFGLEISRHVSKESWEVYLPVIVYAEKAVLNPDVADSIVEGLSARVIYLTPAHIEELGQMWTGLRWKPRKGETWSELYKRHKCDWLIAAMAKQENWLLVSNDRDFQRIKDDVGLRVMRSADFQARYLGS